MSAHAASVRTLFAVFVALFILTIATAVVAFFDLGFLNTPIALGIGRALEHAAHEGRRRGRALLVAHHVRAHDERLPDAALAWGAGALRAIGLY